MPHTPFALPPELLSATEDAWRRAAETSLKGRSLDDLIVNTLDGLKIRPLYSRSDRRDRDAAAPLPGVAPFTAGATPLGGWQIRQSQRHPDPAIANAAIKEDLAAGGTAADLRVDPTGADGIALRGLDNARSAVEGIDPAKMPLHLTPSRPEHGPAIATLIAAALHEAGHDLSAWQGGLGLSPLLGALPEGGWPSSPDAALDAAAGAAAWAADHAPALKALTVRADLIHNAGGSEIQEIAAALADGTALMRVLAKAGLTPDAAARTIEIRLAVDADIFPNIAKAGALRRCWARMTSAFGAGGPGGAPAAIHAVSSHRMLTAYDPYVNLLRGTVACFAAASAGAAAITIAPFTDTLGLPASHARRLARNTQIILMEESHLGQVAAPAADSPAVRDVTDQMAAAAWALFQEIERRGGLAPVLQDGWLQQRIAETRAKRLDRLRRQQDVLTGVTGFPNLDELAPDCAPRPDLPAAPDTYIPETDGFAAHLEQAGDIRLGSAQAPKMSIETLTAERSAAPFETLRRAADAHTTRTGARPSVFLAAMGPLAAHTEAASFAKARLAVGGLGTVSGTVSGTGFDTPADAAHAFQESGARVAAICAGAADRAELAAPLAAALKAAGAAHILLVQGMDALPTEIDTNLTGESDLIALHETLHTVLEVQP